MLAATTELDLALALEQINLTNVQQPVQEMLLALVKAAGAQEAKLARLERSMAERPSPGDIGLLVETYLRQHQAVSPLKENRLNTEVATLLHVNDELAAAKHQASRTQEIISHQSAAITDLNSRLEKLTALVESRTSNADAATTATATDTDTAAITATIDKHISSYKAEMEQEMEARLSSHQQEQDRLALERPRRNEELLRMLHNDVADLRMEMDRKANKEQFRALADSKVNNKEYLELASAIHDKVSMTQLTSSVNSQVRPLVQAVAALEKAVVIQAAAAAAAVATDFSDHVDATSEAKPSTSARASTSAIGKATSLQQHLDRKLGPAWDAARSSASGFGGSEGESADMQAVTEIFESLMKSFRIGEVTHLSLDKALALQHESIIRETSSIADHLRQEVLGILNDNRDRLKETVSASVSSVQQKLEGKITDLSKSVDESREKARQSRQKQQQQQQQLEHDVQATIQQLASSTSTALQKKADRAELKDVSALLKSELKDVSSTLKGELSEARNDSRNESRRLSAMLVEHSKSIEEQTQAMLSFSNSQEERDRELDSFFDAVDRTPIKFTRDEEAVGDAEYGMARHTPTRVPSRGNSITKPSRIPVPTADQETEALKRGLGTVRHRAEKAEKEAARLKAALEAKSKELAAAEVKAAEGKIAAAADVVAASSSSSSSSSNAVNTEWRLALGELSASLRRELADKMSRSEFEGMRSPDILRIESSVKDLKSELAAKGESSELQKLTRSFSSLQARVISELTGGLWLWTSRKLLDGGVMPWDSQVVNAAPASLVWRQGSGVVTIRLPGLYRLSLSVFTCLPVKLTVFLNNEPLLSLQPDALLDPEAFSLTAYMRAVHLHAHRDERYNTRRLRHSAGDVTAASLEEVLSLPSDAVLSVKLESSGNAQALLSVRKL